MTVTNHTHGRLAPYECGPAPDATIVYVVVSSPKDVYLEQAWVSIHSLHLYNKDARVAILTDKATADSLTGKRAGIKELVSEIKVVDVPEHYTPLQRSRYLKTTMRRYFSGTMLFVDTDTVITGNLSDLDNFQGEIGAVLDANVTFDKELWDDMLHSTLSNVAGHDIGNVTHYYNSGVVYMRDTENVHRLFDEWHKCWLNSVSVLDFPYDQQSFHVANDRSGNIIKEMSGVYNCQVKQCIKYLFKAKIMHFCDCPRVETKQLSAFTDNSVYNALKEAGEMTDDIHNTIVECKSSFNDATVLFSKQQAKYSIGFDNELFELYQEYKKNTRFYRHSMLLLRKFRRYNYLLRHNMNRFF